MSKEKSIEATEVFSILSATINGANFDDLCDATHMIVHIAGYRKQSEIVQEIADFIYDGEIEGLNIEMNGRYLGKNDFIKEFTTPKGGE